MRSGENSGVRALAGAVADRLDHRAVKGRNVVRLAAEDEGTVGCDIAGYCSDVAVTTTCILPLLSTESEVKTTVGLPTGMNTMECHLFWRMTGW